MKENDGGGWQLFFKFFRKLWREKFSCPSCRARSARSVPLSLQEPAMPCRALRVPERFNRACVRRALASLSTTATLVDGVSRALRAADSASHISPLSFDGDKRGRLRQFCAWPLIRSSHGQVRRSDCWQIFVRFRIWVRIYHLVPRRHQRARLPHQHASQSCGGTSRWLAPSYSSQCLGAKLRVFQLRILT